MTTGLNGTLYRFYDPELGRWLNRDPLGESDDSLNLYAYVDNDPIDAWDPLGLENRQARRGARDPSAQPQGYNPQQRNGAWWRPWGYGPDWHQNRNRNNECPKKEPKEGLSPNGETWCKDVGWYGTYFKKGNSYRSDKGNECVYDANGNLLPNNGTFNYFPFPRSWGHVIYDAAAAVLWGDSGPNGQTTAY